MKTAAMLERPILFDATRLIWRAWTRRLPTGIDRVCTAYLDRFAARSHAVVQHKGAIRILTAEHSDALFDVLRGPVSSLRRRLALLAPAALARGRSTLDAEGAVYLNVGHTDFDLPAHARWTERCRLRPVYLVHDLIPVTHPELCRPHAVTRHRGRVKEALRSAAGIVVNSQSTANELVRFAQREALPTPPVLAAALGTLMLSGREPAFPAPLPRPYFVCVGTIERRKNHAMLLRVWRRLIGRMGTGTPGLVLIGQRGVDAPEVDAMLRDDAGLRAHVHLMPRCPDGVLARWVAGAEALLMPTLAEGFGLPMAEAFALGTPVIASDLPCFREVGQGIPTLLDPHDVAAWERAIRSFATGPEQRQQRAAVAGYRPATWDDHFSSVESWLEALPLPAFAASGRCARGAAGGAPGRSLAGSLALGAAGE